MQKSGTKTDTSQAQTRVRVFAQDNRMWHQVQSEAQPIRYAIGSGRIGRSYLVRKGVHLFQSPVTFYEGPKHWALSPGYEKDEHPDFFRQITPECLFCHTSARGAEPVPIGCARCHGDGQAHAANPSEGNIVNPAKLNDRARDSVCEQCHLGGEIRIALPGKSTQDFKPGMLLEEVVATFVNEGRTGGSITGHVEQLAASRCRDEAGARLSCGACHNPHPTHSEKSVNQRCQQCHARPSKASHDNFATDCVSCHMPRLPAIGVPHSATTSHLIERAPRLDGDVAAVKQLDAWPRDGSKRSSALAKRNLGLANHAIGQRDANVQLLGRAFALLSETQKEFSADSDVLSALGLMLLQKSVPGAALRLFSEAARLEPKFGRHHLNRAIALLATGNTREAEAELEKAIALEPSLREAYVVLAGIYHQRGRVKDSRRVLESWNLFFR
ncbi:MAG: tetratricopeptide repeat protein [Rhizobiales bacterium]|nr:tetratricopeptide repeat protein [Hyphomicrobiales bacterium]